jgi:hypothetical protein
MPDSPHSDRSRSVALALAVTLGPFGGHRFYAGRTRSGLAMLATLGGLGLWWLYDCIIVGAGQFRDVAGRRIVRWDPDVPEPWESAQADPRVLEEVEALRLEVADLAERLDFAERLLGRGAGRAP